MARRHLEGLGYRILAENYTVRGGEIDLVAQDGRVLVFIEVKQRSTGRYGSAAEGISGRKLHRLRRAALHYLVRTCGTDDVPVRFDPVLLSGPRERCRLEHLRAVL